LKVSHVIISNGGKTSLDTRKERKMDIQKIVAKGVISERISRVWIGDPSHVLPPAIFALFIEKQHDNYLSSVVGFTILECICRIEDSIATFQNYVAHADELFVLHSEPLHPKEKYRSKSGCDYSESRGKIAIVPDYMILNKGAKDSHGKYFDIESPYCLCVETDINGKITFKSNSEVIEEIYTD